MGELTASIMPTGNVETPKNSYGNPNFKAAEYHNQAVERRK